MIRPSRPSIGPTAALLAAVLVFGTGCIDRPPPQFDDQHQREAISADYQTVHDDIENRRATVDEHLEAGRAQVAETGEITFPEVEIEELIDDEDHD